MGVPSAGVGGGVTGGRSPRTSSKPGLFQYRLTSQRVGARTAEQSTHRTLTGTRAAANTRPGRWSPPRFRRLPRRNTRVRSTRTRRADRDARQVGGIRGNLDISSRSVPLARYRPASSKNLPTSRSRSACTSMAPGSPPRTYRTSLNPACFSSNAARRHCESVGSSCPLPSRLGGDVRSPPLVSMSTTTPSSARREESRAAAADRSACTNSGLRTFRPPLMLMA